MKSRLDDNLSYKFVALGVAIILWMSMLGRKDATVVKDFEIQAILAPHLELEGQIPKLVRAEIAGPRVALKRVQQMLPVFTIDLSQAQPGRQVIRMSEEGLNLPIGSRVISFEPREFTVSLRRSGKPGER